MFRDLGVGDGQHFATRHSWSLDPHCMVWHIGMCVNEFL